MARPCDGDPCMPIVSLCISGGSGSVTRRISLRVAKSMTAKPWNSESCTIMSFAVNAMGRTPASILRVQASSFVLVSITLMSAPEIEPATAPCRRA